MQFYLYLSVIKIKFMTDSKAKVKFNFFDFLFTPYKDEESNTSSSKILNECIKKINDEKTQKQKAIVINRFEGRKDESQRNLFVSSCVFFPKEKRHKCQIALIREDKIPTLFNKSTYSLTPFDQLGAHAIAETTNFYIDMSGYVPVVCCEFNSFGPRISDIEYYFRQISSLNMLKISRGCRASIHMKLPIGDVLNSITDVLKFEIKSRPNRLSYLYQGINDPFILNINALANTINPKQIKIDAFFRERGKGTSSKKNTQALGFVKKLLNAVKNNDAIVDDIDDFYLEFERNDGSEDVFNLIKGKEEIVVDCSYKTPGNYDTRELYVNCCIQFEQYIAQRNG